MGKQTKPQWRRTLKHSETVVKHLVDKLAVEFSKITMLQRFSIQLPSPCYSNLSVGLALGIAIVFLTRACMRLRGGGRTNAAFLHAYAIPVLPFGCPLPSIYVCYREFDA